MTTPRPTTTELSESQLRLHVGVAFLRTASTYPTLLDALFEQVQNALDANAPRVWIRLDHKSRHLTVRDNGDGVTRRQFDEALLLVGETRKSSEKLGRFGIGLISPLGKCESFTFTSFPKYLTQQGYLEWTFHNDTILHERAFPAIPVRQRPELTFAPEGNERSSKQVPWRTEVSVNRFTTDRFLSAVTMGSLADGIIERYGSVMRRLGTMISIVLTNEEGVVETKEIRASSYTGTPLEEITVQYPEVGKVTFQLFRARKGVKGPQGRVHVGETANSYRFSFRDFARSVHGLLNEEVAGAFLSGIFEGEITGEKAQLDPGRKSFVRNDACVSFCLALERWFKQVGEAHLADATSERRHERYQELGRISMESVEALVTDPSLGDALRSVIEGFKRGTIGREHADLPNGKMLGKQERPSVSTEGIALPPRRKGERGGDGGDGDSERKSHTPFTVQGPHGRRRIVVKNDSLGIQFAYDEMETNARLWDLDVKNGILRFNIRHPIWVECDKKDRWIVTLQEFIAVGVLNIQAMPEDWHEACRLMFDEQLKLQAYLIVHADRTGRGPARRTKNSN